ncbi:polyphosphoinositide phosphatase [Malassezia pachydermatis]|uniref:Polyphosphoinositide phosphatase n=1 Tax=Malassezia pachydermatis TaxID=77020 RepID=A0A0M8MTB2_9BASI|nr:polyphosphoinositide phosphatase [Malassezia pachydermatis]KOS13924.1 polyphosphoinositide phosphatase [Malassezia pachydermatis]
MSEFSAVSGSDPLPESDVQLLASISGNNAALPAVLPAPGPARATSVGPTGDPTPAREQHRAPLHLADEELVERPGDLMRFTLYETRHYFYLISHGSSQSRYRVLKIDRTPPIAGAEQRQETMQTDTSSESKSSDVVPDLPTVEDLSRGIVEPVVQHARDNSLSDVVVSIASGADELTTHIGQAPSGTLSSEIAELATSLLPDKGKDDADAGERETERKFLRLYDPEVVNLPSTTEWKNYTGEEAELPRDASLETHERTVPPLAALSAPRSPKHSHRLSLLTTSSVHVPESSISTEEETEPKKAKKEPTMNLEDDEAWTLNVTGYSTEYSPEELTDILSSLQEGSRGSGGLKEVGRYFGLIGFIRFTAGYYMVLVSKRSVVSLIGGHYIYHCDETQVLPVCHSSVLSQVLPRSKTRDQKEAQLLRSFNQVDLSKNFYFSYTYDLTRTLQENMTGPRVNGQLYRTMAWGYNEKFMWNFHLLTPAFEDCRNVEAPEAQREELLAKRQWVIPLLHGFVDQAKLSVLGNAIYICLIARRSRHMAGARFYKRGISEDGHVANDVETEQIVNKPITSPFFAPPGRYMSQKDHVLRPSPHFTSYVMMRGSIPIYWTQDSTNMSPKPPIELSIVDPYFIPAALHFNELFHAYGTPVIVLNLIKGKERQPRESKLRDAYDECVKQLNQFLPKNQDGKNRQIQYLAWDMSRASKSRNADVIGFLEQLAETTLQETHFFHSGPVPIPFRDSALAHTSPLLMQNGVVRVNCVDCLDRTNAAQFVLGKAALAYQLHALGLLQHPHLSFDSNAVNMLTEMYHDLGDTIALQYGGSALAHTTDTYRKINHWTSHSRDMLEGLRRYYANSFNDAEKQASIDLFLGQAPCDTGEFLPRNVMPDQVCSTEHLRADEDLYAKASYLSYFVNADKGFWEGYYRPSLFTECVYDDF